MRCPRFESGPDSLGETRVPQDPVSALEESGCRPWPGVLGHQREEGSRPRGAKHGVYSGPPEVLRAHVMGTAAFGGSRVLPFRQRMGPDLAESRDWRISPWNSGLPAVPDTRLFGKYPSLRGPRTHRWPQNRERIRLSKSISRKSRSGELGVCRRVPECVGPFRKNLFSLRCRFEPVDSRTSVCRGTAVENAVESLVGRCEENHGMLPRRFCCYCCYLWKESAVRRIRDRGRLPGRLQDTPRSMSALEESWVRPWSHRC